MFKETINDFKEIWRDKKERKEFIGGMCCVIAMFAVTYVWMVIAYAIQG